MRPFFDSIQLYDGPNIHSSTFLRRWRAYHRGDNVSASSMVDKYKTTSHKHKKCGLLVPYIRLAADLDCPAKDSDYPAVDSDCQAKDLDCPAEVVVASTAANALNVVQV